MFATTNAINLKLCHEENYKHMVFHKCHNLKEYSNIVFHDFTGENDIFLVNNKVYTNRGIITAMYKSNILYIGKKQYSKNEWKDAFINL